VISQQVEIRTADGVADAMLVRPDTSGALPGVLQLTDVFGLRPAFVELAERIAARGYAVLTPNIFYRTTKAPVFDFEPVFPSERTTNRIRELTGPLTPEAMTRDGSDYIDYMATLPLVSRGPMGVVGFCFSGPFALRIAALRPDRVAAAASFHGGRLVTDTDQSPHLLLPQVKARLYFGHAVNDQGMPADAIERLGGALQAWGGTWESETYDGALHGWMIPGRKVYHPEQAERGFAKLMELLDATLRSTVQRL
jgi:carboxymethylenebutenolidase